MIVRTLLALLILAVTGCGEDRAEPAAAGGVRIAAVTPAAAVTLRDLGMEDLVVGRHGFDMVLDPALPVCGDQAGLDYEQLVRVRPTHVVIQWGAREPPARLGELSQELGFEVIDLPLLTLGEVRASIVTLAGIDGTTDAGPLLARWDGAVRARGGVFTGPTLLLGSVDPPAALGPGSFHHQLLVSLGGTPAITDGAPWIEMDAEDVRTLDPAAIVLVLPGASGVAPDLLGSLGRLELSAVAAGRVGLVSDELAHLPGSSLIGVAEQLAGEIGGFDPSGGAP